MKTKFLNWSVRLFARASSHSTLHLYGVSHSLQFSLMGCFLSFFFFFVPCMCKCPVAERENVHAISIHLGYDPSLTCLINFPFRTQLRHHFFRRAFSDLQVKFYLFLPEHYALPPWGIIVVFYLFVKWFGCFSSLLCCKLHPGRGCVCFCSLL